MSLFLQNNRTNENHRGYMFLSPVNPKTDYVIWVSYSRFVCTNAIWAPARQPGPLYSLTNTGSSGTSLLHAALELPTRTTTRSGHRVWHIYISYEIEAADISGISANLLLQDNVPSVTNISIDTTELNAGTTIGKHYRRISVNEPAFINTPSSLSIELEITKSSFATVRLYGARIEYDYDAN